MCAGRQEILQSHIQKQGLPLGEDVTVGSIAASTTGFTGADLANLVNEAALLAGRSDKGVTSHICLFTWRMLLSASSSSPLLLLFFLLLVLFLLPFFLCLCCCCFFFVLLLLLLRAAVAAAVAACSPFPPADVMLFWFCSLPLLRVVSVLFMYACTFFPGFLMTLDMPFKVTLWA